MNGRRQAVTISDVAAAAGVSKSMVSYALNDRPGVNADTRERIASAARDLGWKPSLRGRALSSSRAYTVGLVFRRSVEELSTDQFYTLLMAGIQSVLSDRGYALVTEVVHSEEAEREVFASLSRDGRVDGFFISDLRDDDPRLDVVRAHHLHAMLLERPSESHGHPVMHSDDAPAAHAVIDRLVELGHRRIGIVAGIQELRAARHRREYYQDAMRGHGLDDSLWVATDYSPAQGADATARLLALPDRPTAIVYANDLMAMAGMATVVKHGLSVPGDISVVGWEDIPIARHLAPALASVANDTFNVGAIAARALLDAIEGATFAEEIPISEPRFVPRHSIGPVPAGS